MIWSFYKINHYLLSCDYYKQKEKENQYYLNVYRGQAKEYLNLITIRKPLDSACPEAVYLPRSRLEELAWQENFPKNNQMSLGTSI